MKRVLFLCTDNASRSQMAEGLLRDRCGALLEVASAGLRPTEVHPLAGRVMAEVGIDVSRQRSKGIKPFLGRLPVTWAIIVCAPSEADCPKIYPDALETLRWEMPDPSKVEGPEDVRLAAFREIRDRLAARIDEWSVWKDEP